MGLSPKDVSFSSKKKVWWVCSHNHEWQTEIYVRSVKNCGCRKCLSDKFSSFPEQAIYYYLKTVYPDTINATKGQLGCALELDIYIPSIKTAIEYDGLLWHTDVEKDIRKNKLCCEYGIRLIRVRENGLPDIPGSINIFRIKNKNNDDLNETLLKLFDLLNLSVIVNVNEDAQKIYSQYICGIKENSLAKKFPSIANEWNFNKNGRLSPDNISYGSGRKVWWLCEKGHEWISSVDKRTIRGDGCPYCSGKRVLKGFNDLCTTHPDLLKEWDFDKNVGISIDSVSAGSNINCWWICSICGHKWCATVVQRTSGHGCMECSKKQRGLTHSRTSAMFENDLVSKFPNLVCEWNYDKNTVLPSEVGFGSNMDVWWKCKNGHDYLMKVCRRTSKGTGCPICAGRQIQIGCNDLATLRPDLLIDWDYDRNSIKPTDATIGSNKLIFWKCHNCGFEYQRKVKLQVARKIGHCPICRE